MILAVDCCFESCSAALFDGRRIVASAFERMQRGQAERLAPMVAEVLDQADGAGLIRRIGVTTGPGTFTGVRIGLSFARAFALARGIPCVGVNSLRAVALADGTDGVRTGVHLAPQGVYLQSFQDGAPLGEAALLALDDAIAALPLGDLVLAGTGAELAGKSVGPRARISEAALPDARIVARLTHDGPDPLTPPSPLYLRAPDIRSPKRLIRPLESLS